MRTTSAHRNIEDIKDLQLKDVNAGIMKAFHDIDSQSVDIRQLKELTKTLSVNEVGQK